VEDAFGIHLGSSIVKSFYQNKWFEFSSGISGIIGSDLNQLAGTINFRLGKINPIYASSFYHSNFSNSENVNKEFFGFVSFSGLYKAHDISVSGKISSSEDPHPFDFEKMQFQGSAGITHSKNRITSSIWYHYQSKEVLQATEHYYGGVLIGYSF